MAAGRGGGHHSYPRTARINQILREVISGTVVRLSDIDERFGLLTVTGVECAPDLHTAKVFFDSISDGAREGLDERRAYIQSSVNAQTRMKRTPILTFLADPAVAAGTSVEEIIRRLHDDES